MIKTYMKESKPGSSVGMFFVASSTCSASSSVVAAAAGFLGVLAGVALGVFLMGLLMGVVGDALTKVVLALAPSSGLDATSPYKIAYARSTS